jgi:hypothetical protein
MRGPAMGVPGVRVGIRTDRRRTSFVGVVPEPNNLHPSCAGMVPAPNNLYPSWPGMSSYASG